jgi:hypothetical protein
VISGALQRWAVASNDRAVANARLAATACSQARVERAEVAQFLAALTDNVTETLAERPRLDAPVRGTAAGR